MRASKSVILAIIMVINLQFVAMIAAQPTFAVGMNSGNFCAKITQDGSGSEHLDELAKKYSSESQKQALEAYRLTISKAVQDRRVSVDKIRQDFRTKLMALSSNHQAKLQDAENELLASLEQAINTASDSCKSGVDAGSIKAQFDQAILNAKTKFTEK